MKIANAVKVARPVRIIQNSSNAQSAQWGQIRCDRTNRVLHTGRLPYIKQVARKRYNLVVDFA